MTPGTLRFAVIGDYGGGGQAEAAVAALVTSWNPDLVITLGDNNYPAGEATTIDPHIGQFYHDFIFPYTGSYGAGATENRFFPATGNHDWMTGALQPYLDYFTLPGNERYYDFGRGAVHFFAVDSDSQEPDGITDSSTQALWLQNALAAAPEPWKLIYFHHAPYSSAAHGSNTTLQWPYAAWGATAGMSGPSPPSQHHPPRPPVAPRRCRWASGRAVRAAGAAAGGRGERADLRR